MTEIGYLLVIVAILISAAVLLVNRWQTKRLLLHLDSMLDQAVRGEFMEKIFDESLLSCVEAKLARYLSAASLSAQSSQEEKEQIQSLIGDISHQIKTPVANVLLYAQLLGEQQLPEEAYACARALEQQALKLQILVDALVKTSRLETGVLVLHPQPGPLSPMLEEVVAQYAVRAEEKGLTLFCRFTSAVAVFDRKWTAEAVCNLLDNAVKYTPSGGIITVKTAVYEMFCRIDVMDSGPGIPEAEQAKVFQRFYRSAAVHEIEGVGIGLYLARQIVRGQGGYIKVSSQMDQGTCFSIYLPRN